MKKSTIQQEFTRAFMGKNFFGIEEAIKYFGVNPTRQQLAALSKIPFSETVLEESKDTHILVAVFPLSILEIRDKVERKLFYSHENAWYNKQAFAKVRSEACWQLVRKTPVENSAPKTWQKQQALLAENEETPTIQVMVYTIIGHFLAIGEWLFEEIYIRCPDLSSDGHRVYIGYFDSGGLRISVDWNNHCYGNVGVASARKSD